MLTLMKLYVTVFAKTSLVRTINLFFSVQLVAMHYTVHMMPILDWSAFLRAALNSV